jgi:hypothetical protein
MVETARRLEKRRRIQLAGVCLDDITVAAEVL